MRLPVAVPPARHETVASYLTRLARLHGLAPGELWHQVSSPQPGTHRREVVPDRLAAITGRPAEHLAWALPELRHPGPDWQAWRHQPQPGCLRCDAGHDGGPVTRLLPHHRYVCTRHRYWIGPPDAGQPATPLGPELASILLAQRRHLRLLRRYGTALTYDAVLTGFLLCGHLWTDQPGDWDGPWQRWTRRAEVLIPPGAESSQFSAARIFAAAYPEAVALADLIASPAWRSLAAGDPAQQRQFTTAIGQRLGQPGYQPAGTSDPIAHWMKYDSWRPPSRPHTTFPQTRRYGSNPDRPATTSRQSLQRHERSTLWFQLYRRGGRVILHHGHIRPVLIRDWSRPMDGIAATIWASQTTLPSSLTTASTSPPHLDLAVAHTASQLHAENGLCIRLGARAEPDLGVPHRQGASIHHSARPDQQDQGSASHIHVNTQRVARDHRIGEVEHHVAPR
jgi:TniQ